VGLKLDLAVNAKSMGCSTEGAAIMEGYPLKGQTIGIGNMVAAQRITAGRPPKVMLGSNTCKAC